MTISFGNTKDLGGSVKVVSYGPAGIGKTRMCATAPRPLVISAESGLLSLKKAGLPYMTVESLDDFRGAYLFVTENPKAAGFETICIDSASDIAQSALSVFKTQFTDARQAYGALDDMLVELRKWRQLPGRNVYITCKEEVWKETGQHMPSMPGNILRAEMPYLMDELICFRKMTGEDGKERRVIQCHPDIDHYAKDRSGALAQFEPPDLTHIFNKIKEH